MKITGGRGFDLDEYKKFIQNQKQLENVEWREFRISEVFEVVNSKAYHKTSLQKGFTPYITRTSFNNGLEAYVKSDNLQLNPKILSHWVLRMQIFFTKN
ncbi:restriction endonuclease subunit S [Campylobacter jejuni]